MRRGTAFAAIGSITNLRVERVLFYFIFLPLFLSSPLFIPTGFPAVLTACLHAAKKGTVSMYIVYDLEILDRPFFRLSREEGAGCVHS